MGTAMSGNVSLTLPRDPTAAGIARREVARLLGESLGDRLGDVELVVSELVNNAFLHGCGEVGLALRLDGGQLRGHVTDDGDGFSQTANERRIDEVGGFGLGIVAALTSRWGVREATAQVWFEMELAAAAVSGAGTAAPDHAGGAPSASGERELALDSAGRRDGAGGVASDLGEGGSNHPQDLHV